jgi:hypothetical protein
MRQILTPFRMSCMLILIIPLAKSNHQLSRCPLGHHFIDQSRLPIHSTPLSTCLFITQTVLSLYRLSSLCAHFNPKGRHFVNHFPNLPFLVYHSDAIGHLESNLNSLIDPFNAQLIMSERRTSDLSVSGVEAELKKYEKMLETDTLDYDHGRKYSL